MTQAERENRTKFLGFYSELPAEVRAKIDVAIIESSRETGIGIPYLLQAGASDKKEPTTKARAVLFEKLRALDLSYPMIGWITGTHHTTPLLALRREQNWKDRLNEYQRNGVVAGVESETENVP